jgi:hypothetical protein
MTQGRLRLYYHLFNGPSWRAVWDLHGPRLDDLLKTSAVERAVVCCHGFREVPDLSPSRPGLEVRTIDGGRRTANEFGTLAQLRRDALQDDAAYDAVAYLHSKGASAPTLSSQAASWTDWLAESLAGLVRSFDRIGNAGFEIAGSNLAWGVFEAFEAPRLHYSGNLWCASRDVVRRAAPIDLDARGASVRHAAEWWVGTGRPRGWFNLFSSGLDHYDATGALVDRGRLRERLAALELGMPPVARSDAQQAFVRRQFLDAVGEAPVRRAVSRTLLAALPYGRWRRAYSLHDVVTRRMGSRKSAYVLCGES